MDAREPSRRRFDLAVIGGSSGAVEALGRIIPALPAESWLPIAVVVHVAPDRPSLLPSLMATHARVEVREAADKDRIVAGTVYFAPSGYHLLVERGGTLALSVDPPVHYCRPSVDVLFQSASEAIGPGVLGIILTGANSDGAEGLRCIRESGGVAIVQAPSDASSPEMPRAAILAATPNMVLTLAEIAEYLRRQALPS
jgi:two-component system chemotaxis response regulator CheB